jgi:hypothetical protein
VDRSDHALINTPLRGHTSAQNEASLCQGVVLGVELGATVWPMLGGRVGRSVGVGFGTDLSEEPVSGC